MVSIKSYPSTKASNVVWVGEIPDTWQIHQGKRIFRNRREPADKHDMQLAASQKYGVIPQEQMMKLNDSKVMLALKGTESFRHVEQDDFVISLRSFEGGIEHSDFQGCVSPAYTVLSASKKLVPKYFKYLFKSQPYISALQASTDSLRDGKSISYEQFGSIPLILPPVTEQAQITFFLDRETAKIDRLIEKQQQLIELLEEKRQAVISHAVSKGLNPDVPMKDSGVEWLGEVPEHWEVKKLRYVAKVQSGVAKGKKYDDQVELVRLPYLRVANVQDGHIDTQEMHEIEISNSEVERYLLQDGDVLMNEGGDNDKLGRGAVWHCQVEPCIHQNHVFAVRLCRHLEPEWLAIFTRGSNAKFYFYSVAKQSTNLASISSSNIKNLSLPVPPTEERAQILDHIDRSLSKINTTIRRATDSIALLTERRTALISAAVTGKIDVRDQVPQDVEEAVAS